jgi:hypothetical protein
LKKDEIISHLKDAGSFTVHSIILGRCLGKSEDVFPNIDFGDWYRSWIFEVESDEGIFQVCMWDEGNGWYHFECEGTEEAIRTHLKTIDEESAVN